jgi:hypothetical protein
MKKTILTTEGKRLEINPDTDTCLIRQPRPVTRTGTDYAHGEDLYLTDDRAGIRHYYVISWILQAGDYKESYRTLDEQEKDRFILAYRKKAGKIGLDPDVSDRLGKYFPGLLKD